MRERAAPHEVGAGIVIVRLFESHRCPLHDFLEQCERQLVREVESIALMEISLKCVHHDIGGTAGRLVFGNGRCQHRIEQSELDSSEVGVDASLEYRIGLIVSDD